MLRKSLILLVLLTVVLAACSALPNLDLSEEATAESTESAELAVDGAPSITIDHFAGTVTVHEGDAGRIMASVVKQSHLQDEAEAQSQLERIVLAIEQTDGGPRVAVQGPEGLTTLRELPVGLTAELDVTVPPGSAVSVNFGAGEITIDHPTGDVRVDSGAGKVKVILSPDASFDLKIDGGVTNVDSDFEGVSNGGVGTDVAATIGSNPTQSITINLGAGDVNLESAP